MLDGPQVNQNQIAKHPDEITLETEKMRKRAAIDEKISTFPSTYEKEWSDTDEFYYVKLPSNTLTANALIGYFEGKTVELLRLNLETDAVDTITTGDLISGYDYGLYVEDVLCLYFKIN